MRVCVMLLAVAMLLGACQPAPAAPAAATRPPAASAPAASAPATAAPAAPPAAAPAPPRPETVKVSSGKTVSDAGLAVGLTKGYYQEQGIVVEDIYIPTGAEAVSLLATEQLDIALGAHSAGLFNAIGRGAAIRIVGDKGSTPPGFGYVALTVRRSLMDSGEFRGPADLRGRTIAVAGTGITQQVDIARLLARANLAPDDASTVVLALRDMPAALANGSIDIAYAIEPGVTRLVEDGVAVRWLGTDEISPGRQVAALMYADGFAQQRRAAAERFMVAYARSLKDYIDAFQHGRGREEVIQSLMEWSGLKDRPLYDRMVPAGFHPDGCPNADTIRQDYEWWLANGHVQAPVNLDQVIDSSFCQHAARTLGTSRP